MSFTGAEARSKSANTGDWSKWQERYDLAKKQSRSLHVNDAIEYLNEIKQDFDLMNQEQLRIVCGLKNLLESSNEEKNPKMDLLHK